MPDREVIRCPWCQLNQYVTKSGLCRKPECGKPLKPTVDFSGLLTECKHDAAVPFYRPSVPIRFHPRAEALMAKQIIPAFDTGRIIQDIVSNVRRKKKQPRYVAGYLLVPNFPTDLRLRLLDYAQSNNMLMRDVVVRAIQNHLDKV